MKKKFEDKTKFGKFLKRAKDRGVDVLQAIQKAKQGDYLGAYAEAKSALSNDPNNSNDDLVSELISKKQEFKSDYELFLADTQDARNNETIRDISENSSWLSKNIHEIIAIVFVFGWFVMIIVLIHLFLNEKITLNQLIGLLAATGIKDMILLILGYLYGRTKPQT